MNEPVLEYELITNGIRVIAGTAYVAYICAGGSGFNIAVGLNGEQQEGTEEIPTLCKIEMFTRIIFY